MKIYEKMSKEEIVEFVEKCEYRTCVECPAYSVSHENCNTLIGCATKYLKTEIPIKEDCFVQYFCEEIEVAE